MSDILWEFLFPTETRQFVTLSNCKRGVLLQHVYMLHFSLPTSWFAHFHKHRFFFSPEKTQTNVHERSFLRSRLPLLMCLVARCSTYFLFGKHQTKASSLMVCVKAWMTLCARGVAQQTRHPSLVTDTDSFYRFYYENHDDDFSKARVQSDCEICSSESLCGRQS